MVVLQIDNLICLFCFNIACCIPVSAHYDKLVRLLNSNIIRNQHIDLV